MEPATAILISAALATCGWVYSGRIQRLTSRRQHTYSVIMRQLDDDQFASALAEVRAAVRADIIPAPVKESPTQQHLHIDYLLNHYEFLCAAILCGDVDERMLRSCEFSRITKLFDKMYHYIGESRRQGEQPTMFENLEMIAHRWRRPYRPAVERLCEAFLFRPLKTAPFWLAWCIRIEDGARGKLKARVERKKQEARAIPLSPPDEAPTADRS